MLLKLTQLFIYFNQCLVTHLKCHNLVYHFEIGEESMLHLCSLRNSNTFG